MTDLTEKWKADINQLFEVQDDHSTQCPDAEF